MEIWALKGLNKLDDLKLEIWALKGLNKLDDLKLWKYELSKA
jgi:hypothetical protein